MTFRHPSSGTFTFDTQTGADADEFLWTDPVATNQTLPQPEDIDRRWCWHDLATVSVDVGPTSGAGGSPDGYVYTEASSPAAAADEFYMEFDTTLDASTNDITVEFKTNQRGTTNEATCVVQTNENGGGWVDRGATFGGASDPDHVNDAGTQIWSSRSVDLAGLISHASTRIRLKIVLGSTVDIWANDYAIDEVLFIGTTPTDTEQEGFQFREDDGSESAATDIGAQDANATRGKLVATRLRILTETDTGDPATATAALEYRKVGDADSEWRKVPI